MYIVQSLTILGPFFFVSILTFQFGGVNRSRYKIPKNLESAMRKLSGRSQTITLTQDASSLIVLSKKVFSEYHNKAMLL